MKNKTCSFSCSNCKCLEEDRRLEYVTWCQIGSELNVKVALPKESKYIVKGIKLVRPAVSVSWLIGAGEGYLHIESVAQFFLARIPCTVISVSTRMFPDMRARSIYI